MVALDYALKNRVLWCRYDMDRIAFIKDIACFDLSSRFESIKFLVIKRTNFFDITKSRRSGFLSKCPRAGVNLLCDPTFREKPICKAL